MTQDQKTRWTQSELISEAMARFGDNPLDWAFECPSCGDVATARAFREVGADPHRVGQECIGRPITSRNRVHGRDPVEPRGCDWAAYGLFRGPWFVTLPDDNVVPSFPLAAANRD